MNACKAVALCRSSAPDRPPVKQPHVCDQCSERRCWFAQHALPPPSPPTFCAPAASVQDVLSRYEIGDTVGVGGERLGRVNCSTILEAGRPAAPCRSWNTLWQLGGGCRVAADGSAHAHQAHAPQQRRSNPQALRWSSAGATRRPASRWRSRWWTSRGTLRGTTA